MLRGAAVPWKHSRLTFNLAGSSRHPTPNWFTPHGAGLTTCPFSLWSPMTLEISDTGVVTANYSKAHELSVRILTAIKKEQVGYGQLACALSLGRLYNPTKTLTIEEELAFVQECMNWVDVYFAVPAGTEGN